jgi:predicted transcriptional regulator
MGRRTFTQEEIDAWIAYRQAGNTIEQTALDFGVSTQTVQKYTPKGIKNESKKGKKRHLAHPANKAAQIPGPTARIVRTSVAKRFR